jgi:hypothetical protein
MPFASVHLLSVDLQRDLYPEAFAGSLAWRSCF